MSILGYLVFGLIIGAIAKLIMGRHMGWIGTLICGVIGAILGGWIGALILGKDPVSADGMSNPLTWLFALIGTAIVLVIWGFIASRNKASGSGSATI